MVITFETLLGTALGIGIALLVITWIWMGIKASRASQIANTLTATFICVVEMGMLVNDLINGRDWKYTFFLCCLWLANVTVKAIYSIFKQK